MLDYLRPGDRFIDVGANIGLYTLLALSIVGPKGHVHSFEPIGRVANRLRESLDINGIVNATVHDVAVANLVGTVPFDLSADDCTAHISENQSVVNSGNFVDSIRLDKHLPDVPYAMAKLDIEGFEPLALRGASEWLSVGNPPVLQIEMAGYSKRYSITTPEFIDELSQVGYVTAVYSPESRTVERTDRPWEIPVDNVLAICRNRESFVFGRVNEKRESTEP